jgi:hypothetical protein
MYFLFIKGYNSPFYTLVESAKTNDLNVYEYRKYILGAIPDTDFNNHPELLDSYLPWSKKLSEECRLNHKHEKLFKK